MHHTREALSRQKPWWLLLAVLAILMLPPVQRLYDGYLSGGEPPAHACGGSVRIGNGP